ncbi:hypothetical protein [Fodinibius saliphilus]|uniref:hypothetical protein n=1 Tax=Fodinibius saliphilus TaxID=1920650 RepID=UPI001107C464|nr:hypothetical protein [Fodinibius saliphilus]
MSTGNLNIDESEHQRAPTLTERGFHALAALVLGFILINIIAFWMFPGIGIGGVYLLAGIHSFATIFSEVTTVLIYTFLALCFIVGWFQGKPFVDHLKSYISYWRFW